MAQYKLSGGVEDLTFGMGTEQQQRQGAVYVITQIHAGVIPYSSTQSITQKVDQIDSTSSATRADLDNHKLNYNNPHQVTPEDVGAAPLVHTHPESDIDGLTEDLANKSNVGHHHAISDVANLQTDLDAKMDDGDAFLKTDHVVESAGGADAGKPIILDNAGKLDPTIAGSGLIFIAMFTPTAGTEYPDNTGYPHGSYWGIEGVDGTLGYTFVGGDLAGTTLFNGDALVVGAESWGYVNISIDPSLYYKVDGTLAISAPFAGGGQQLKNIADGVDTTDAVALQQLTTGYLPLAGGVLTDNLTIGSDYPSLLLRDTDFVDGTWFDVNVSEDQFRVIYRGSDGSLVSTPLSITNGATALVGNINGWFIDNNEITTDDKLNAGLGTSPRGIAAGGTTDDPNTTITEHILTSHVNGPGAIGDTLFWHIRTQFYFTDTGGRAQIALSYSGDTAKMCIRHNYEDVWSPWLEVTDTVILESKIDALTARLDAAGL